MKILVVDDDPEVIDLVMICLEMEGHEMTSASNGPAGVKKALEVRPDLILMDMMMPKMEDGLEATKAVRAIPEIASTPVIALTGRAMFGDQSKAIEAGCNELITKPFEFDDLIAAVRRNIGKQGNAT